MVVIEFYRNDFEVCHEIKSIPNQMSKKLPCSRCWVLWSVECSRVMWRSPLERCRLRLRGWWTWRKRNHVKLAKNIEYFWIPKIVLLVGLRPIHLAYFNPVWLDPDYSNWLFSKKAGSVQDMLQMLMWGNLWVCLFFL